MKKIKQKDLDTSRERIEERNKEASMKFRHRPCISDQVNRIKFDFSRRTGAIDNGGLACVLQMLGEIGFAKEINSKLNLFRRHKPYFESDHILNIAFNAITGGQTLDDIEYLRNDENHLNMLGTESIPDPTTAGDFCRRFGLQSINDLQDALAEVRLRVWSRGDVVKRNSGVANIDVDGVYTTTNGECKEGMDINYKGTWGHHPLLVSLAETHEPLYILNRNGNRPSHEGFKDFVDKAVRDCRKAGFSTVRVRGDSAFAVTENFDTWDHDGVKFVFSNPAHSNLVEAAGLFDESDMEQLIRKVEREFKRQRPQNVKQQIVEERGYADQRLIKEDLIEFMYRPEKCSKDYRIVVVRKEIEHCKYAIPLFKDYRYFFYVTNDESLNAIDVVWHGNKRCDQENLNAQLQNGVPALRSPLADFNANWALMIINSLAWSFKQWIGILCGSEADTKSEVCSRRRKEGRRMLRMEFRRWLNSFIKIPAQVISSGRQTILRILGWRPGLELMLRSAKAIE